MDWTRIDRIRSANRALVRELGLLNPRQTTAGISFTEGHLLIELDQNGTDYPGELARRLGLDKSTVSNLLSQMLKKGFVQAQTLSADRRKRAFQLTKIGKAKVEQCHSLGRQRVGQTLDFLQDSDSEKIIQAMELYGWALKKARLAEQIHIRPIQPEDDGVMESIIRDSLDHFGISGPGCAAADPELLRLHASYQGAKSTYLIVEGGGRILGGAGIAPLQGATTNIAELQKMYLLPESRGKGVGAMLMECCLDAARQRGFEFVYLETLKKLEQACTLYQRSGFEPCERMGNTGHHQAGLTMIKRLGPSQVSSRVSQ